jgi:hypothetical protein
MKTQIIVAAIVTGVALVIAALVYLRRPGYRGAIGVKNRQASEIAIIRVTGFSRPVECRTLARGEHSFNYLGRQDIPAAVQIAWRLVTDTADRAATVSLSAVPSGAADGELFFVLSADGTWSVEYAPHLRLDELQRGPRG